MRTSTPNILILTGGAITIAPLVFLYLSYRLSSYTLLEGVAAGHNWDKVNLTPVLSEYYVPVALITGLLCIAARNCVGRPR